MPGPVVVYVPSATGTMPQAQMMRNIVWEMLLLVRTSVWGFSQQQEYGRYTFSCAAWEHRRSMRFFVLFSCPHIMTELSCHLQLDPSTLPDTPPVGPTALPVCMYKTGPTTP